MATIMVNFYIFLLMIFLTTGAIGLSIYLFVKNDDIKRERDVLDRSNKKKTGYITNLVNLVAFKDNSLTKLNDKIAELERAHSERSEDVMFSAAAAEFDEFLDGLVEAGDVTMSEVQLEKTNPFLTRDLDDALEKPPASRVRDGITAYTPGVVEMPLTFDAPYDFQGYFKAS